MNSDKVFCDPGKAEKYVLDNSEKIDPICFSVAVNQLISKKLFLERGENIKENFKRTFSRCKSPQSILKSHTSVNTEATTFVTIQNPKAAGAFPL